MLEKQWQQWKSNSGRASHIWANSLQSHSACKILFGSLLQWSQISKSYVSSNSPLLASRSGKLSKGSFLIYLEWTNTRPTSKLHYLASDPLWLGYLNFLWLEIYNPTALCADLRMYMAKLICLQLRSYREECFVSNQPFMDTTSASSKPLTVGDKILGWSLYGSHASSQTLIDSPLPTLHLAPFKRHITTF